MESLERLLMKRLFRTDKPETRRQRPPEGGQEVSNLRGLRNVASYALYSLLCLVLNREAAENLERSDKAVSPTFFNT